MAELFLGLGATLFGGGAAAAGTAAAGTAAATASTGISAATILQGAATVLGVVSAIGAGNAQAAEAEAAAADAETEQALETLQGIDRRTQTRKALIDAVGSIDGAYAASGVDLSVGTVAQARREAFRDADFATATAGNTEIGRGARLSERAARYRAAAKRHRIGGIVDGLSAGAGGFKSILDQV